MSVFIVVRQKVSVFTVVKTDLSNGRIALIDIR